VYITGRKPDRLEAAARTMAGPGTCIALPGDLSRMDEIERIATALAEREGALHVLVNNAGATWGQPIEEFTQAGWERVMTLNLKAPFFLAQRLLPLLKAAATNEDPARILNMSSVAATVVGTDSVAYGPSKAGLEHLTRIMARALGEHRITVNGIAPGWFPSRMNGALSDDAREAWQRDTPLERLGTVEDMGGLAIFLCSRAGAFINGRTIVTDGGRTL
jgi:NAD(P)-dependent dehydrogenase (short-subunit alcohol dehydrogenase family)